MGRPALHVAAIVVGAIGVRDLLTDSLVVRPGTVAAIAAATIAATMLAPGSRELRRRATGMSEALRAGGSLLSLADQMPIMIWATDPELRYTLVRGAAAKEVAEVRGSAVGITAFERFGTTDAAHPVIGAHLRALSGEEVDYEFALAGHTFDAHVRPIRGADGRIVGVAGVAVDTTARHRDQEELGRRHEELLHLHEQRRALEAHLIAAQEEERRRIAEDIHDDTIQVLSAVAMRLELLSRAHPEIAAEDGAGKLDAVVRQAMARLRSLLFDLRPVALDHEGLGAAIAEKLRRLQDEGITTELSDRLTEEPPAQARIVCFRIAQEALANVRRHAMARHVWVRIESRDDRTLVEVKDDGQGFTPGPAPRAHIGIDSMRERAELAGGTFEIESAEGAGTTVRAWVPAAAGAP